VVGYYFCCKFNTESASERFLFENRLTFGEVMGKSLVSCFLTHGVEKAGVKNSLLDDAPPIHLIKVAAKNSICVITAMFCFNEFAFTVQVKHKINTIK